MTETVLYQAGMTLGRTFDLRTHRQGLDIFTEEALKQTKTIERHQNNLQYAVIKESRDVNNILGVSGDISLKVKAGLLKVEGFGSYLKEDRSKENTLEIVARAHVETLTETMTATHAENNWRKPLIGTHFIRSITYGGDLIVRIKIEGSDAIQFEEIEAKVNADLQASGVINAGVETNFRKLEEDIKSSSQIEITYYATSLEGQMPRDISGMLETLDGFKNNVMKLNDGKGVPCTCELVPLNTLDEQLPQVLRDKSLDVQLAQLEDYYDDVFRAKDRLKRVLKREDVYLTDDQETKASDLGNRLDDVQAELNRVISKLDVTSNGNGIDQMNSALDMYKKKQKKAGGFEREVSRFVKSLKSEQAQATPLKDLPPGESLDLVLIGKTGHGKSATANSIFGEDRFASHMSKSSITLKCQYEKKTISGREICLVDTPGTMSTHKPKETLEEVGTAIAYRPDGYHAFLLVLNVLGRMTAEENMAVTMLKKMFGKDFLMKFAVLVFTHGDNFYSCQKKQKTTETFIDFILTQDEEVSSLFEACGRRCVLINNLEGDPGKVRDQVIELIQVIDYLVAGNEGLRYTNKYFELAKKELAKEEAAEKAEIERRRKVMEDEIKAEEESKKEVIKQREIEEAAKRADIERRQKVIEDEINEPETYEMMKQMEKDHAAAITEIEILIKIYADKLRAAREKLVGQKVAEEAVKDGNSCFPADAEVILESGKRIKIKDVVVGDKILSALDGDMFKFSEVYIIVHRDTSVVADFITISTGEALVTMTPDHHVFVVVDGIKQTVPARKVEAGNHILICSEEATLTTQVVTEITRATGIGIYNPLTVAGTIVVNDVLASCYVDCVPPKLAHPLMSPVRQIHKWAPSLSKLVNDPTKTGMPRWIEWLMEYIIVPLKQ